MLESLILMQNNEVEIFGFNLNAIVFFVFYKRCSDARLSQS